MKKFTLTVIGLCDHMGTSSVYHTVNVSCDAIVSNTRLKEDIRIT